MKMINIDGTYIVVSKINGFKIDSLNSNYVVIYSQGNEIYVRKYGMKCEDLLHWIADIVENYDGDDDK